MKNTTSDGPDSLLVARAQSVNFTNVKRTHSFSRFLHCMILVCAICLVMVENTAFALDEAQVISLIEKSKLKPSDFGIIVVNGNRKIVGLNEAKKMKPASLTKVITGAAALELLGPHFKFRTQLLHDGAIVDQSIRGTLFLKAAGDPSFLSTQLSSFVSTLAALKINTVEGDLVVDDSLFPRIIPANWQSQVTNLNPKMFPLFVSTDPPSGIGPDSPQWKEMENVRRRMINLEGRFVIYENVTEPDLWTGYQFRQLLTKKGIRIKGNVVHGKVSESAQVLAEIAVPLTSVIRKMMKASNNYYADMLVRDLPLRFGEKQGKFEDGLEFVKYYLDHAKIARSEYSLNSGSGFSHQNAITPRAIVKLFLHFKDQALLSNDYFGTFPVAGVDGTLRNRMNKTVAQGHIHAKTGYLRPVQTPTTQLTGAVGLAGYADRIDGKTYTFAFLYNGMGDSAVVRKVFDSLGVLVMDGTLQMVAQVKPKKNNRARARK